MKGLLIIMVVAACSAESSSDVEVDSDTVNPQGAVEREFVERAERTLESAPEPDEGWRTGVIVSEDDVDRQASWAILTNDGMTLIEPAWNCSGDDDIDEDQLWVMLDPADLITWAAEGDNQVCTDELRVIEKSAAS